MSSKLRIGLISFGIVYIWFGMLKFFPGASPAEALAGDTITMLSFGMIGHKLALILLAIMEVGIGLFCITGLFPRFAVKVVLAHMICTFTPMFLMPELVFGENLFTLTLVGQYIIKNLVFISSLQIIYYYIIKEQKEKELTQQQQQTQTSKVGKSSAYEADHVEIQPEQKVAI